MAIRVDHATRFDKTKDELAIYVGRPSKYLSPDIMQLNELGNPFPISKGKDRDMVISMYRVWLFNALEEKKEVRNSFRVLIEAAKENDVVLLCWCHPQSCHADIIAEVAQSVMANETQLIADVEADDAFNRAITFGGLDDELDDRIWREMEN